MQDAIKREDFDIVSRELDNLKKDTSRLCTKDELITRLSVFNSDVNTKLHDRPTISYFKKVLGAYDTKIEQFNYALNEQVEKLDITQADQDKEIADLSSEITEYSKDLALKLDKNDATRIWKHFQRFAEYSDLKDLYAKCIPELAKFEQQIINFKDENEKQKMIIEKFDEHLTTKGSKTSVAEVYQYINQNCSQYADQEALKKKVESTLTKYDGLLKEQSNMIEMLERRMMGEVSK